ncbi:hypothetical protein VPH35_093929 [Triticum aestivum]
MVTGAEAYLAVATADSTEKSAGWQAGEPTDAEDKVAEMFERLNLTPAEADALILKDENEANLVNLEFALIGRVLSPNILHIQTIMSALRPAWGNPKGLVAKPVADNIFIAEFATKSDKERVIDGAPWTVGKHAVLLNEFDSKQKPSDFTFKSIMLWARIMNPRIFLKLLRSPTGMASGDCLRVRVSVDITQPLMRYVTSYSMKLKAFERYVVKYESLPHYCFSCGILGHSSLECRNPGERDTDGKLPYTADKLCVKEDKRKGFLVSKSGQSSQSSGRSSYHEDKQGESQPTPVGNSGGKTHAPEEVQGEVVSQTMLQNQSFKQEATLTVGNMIKEQSPLQNTTAKIVGQKRKQTKVYKPKGLVQNSHEILMLENSKPTCTTGKHDVNAVDTNPTLVPSGDDSLSDCYKKQKMETITLTSGSADQAAVAVEQPRHTQ